MTAPAPSPARELAPDAPPRLWRIGVLLSAAAAAVIAAALSPRLAQDRAYLAFVDDRTLLGVPHALDVLSNLGFAVVGLAGLVLLARDRLGLRDRRERWPWLVFFAGVALTSAGSTWFHLDPTLDALAWDRLPMTIGFAGLLAALVAERIDPAAGLALLGPLTLGGLASVAWWIVTEHAGRGDLRPYLLVQYLPLACIVLVLALFPGREGAAGWLGALGLYAAAKVAEVLDGPVYAATGGAVSGHTLKHLLAALGIGVLLASLRRRSPHPGDPASRARGPSAWA